MQPARSTRHFRNRYANRSNRRTTRMRESARMAALRLPERQGIQRIEAVSNEEVTGFLGRMKQGVLSFIFADVTSI